jgi:endogenous inhibitor of DNA gyrase (YacG/DUF329 family)
MSKWSQKELNELGYSLRTAMTKLDKRALGKCKICGESFPKKKSDQIFCSLLCQDNKHHPRKKFSAKNCETCGKRYLRVRKAQRFCSASCRLQDFKGKRLSALDERIKAIWGV